MLKVSSSTIKKVFLQNNLINYLSKDFKFVLFLKQFDGGVNNLNLLKEKSLNVNTEFLNLVYNNFYSPLCHKKNKFFKIKNLFLNKGITIVKFQSYEELNYFLLENNLFDKSNILLLGGLIDSIYWTSNDLSLLKGVTNKNLFNKLKFSLYFKSFFSILNLISFLDNFENISSYSDKKI